MPELATGTALAPAAAVSLPRGAAIASVAMAVPDGVVTNAPIAERLGVAEEWIVKRTGARERHIAEPGQQPANTRPPRLSMLPKGSEMGQPRPTDICQHFFLPEPKVGCQPAPFWLGAAAITLIFSFLGFLVSRLLLCSPLAMSISLNVDGFAGFDTLSHR